MRSLSLILASVVLLQPNAAAEEAPAVFSLVMWRHGDRSVVECFPNTEDDCAERWPDGFGQLTPLGMSMGFNLGKALRARYGDIVPSNYSRTGIHIRSSDYDRTLQTAQSVLTGMWPPGTGPELSNGAPALTPSQLQPIPEHTVPKDDDTLLLAYSPDSCPAMAAADKDEAAMDAKEWDGVKARWDAVKGAVKEATGLSAEELEITSMFAAWDVVVCDLSHGYPLPPGLEGNASLLKTMQETADFTLKHLFASPEQQKLSAGRLIAEFSSRLRAASSGTTQPEWDPMSFPIVDRKEPRVALGPRLWGYSAHDATIVSLLQALQVYDGVHPPYASSVAVELFGVAGQQGQHAVRAFYNTNQTTGNGAFGPQQKLQLPCEAKHDSAWLRSSGLLQAGECTVSDFVSHYAPVSLPGDSWEAACGLSPPSPSPAPSRGWSGEEAGLLAGGTAAGGLLVGALVGFALLPRFCAGRSARRREDVEGESSLLP